MIKKIKLISACAAIAVLAGCSATMQAKQQFSTAFGSSGTGAAVSTPQIRPLDALVEYGRISEVRRKEIEKPGALDVAVAIVGALSGSQQQHKPKTVEGVEILYVVDTTAVQRLIAQEVKPEFRFKVGSGVAVITKDGTTTAIPLN